jgi:hypothetical protein
MYKVLLNENGKRFIVNGLKSTDVAKRAGIAETSAREVLTGGKVRKHWQAVTMQRRKDTMRIYYRITDAGREYASVKDTVYARLLRQLDGAMREAGELSTRCLDSGMSKHCRNRVIMDMARAIKDGYAVQVEKGSNGRLSLSPSGK